MFTGVSKHCDDDDDDDDDDAPLCPAVSSVCFAVVMRLGFRSFVLFLLYVLAVDMLLTGVLVASALW